MSSVLRVFLSIFFWNWKALMEAAQMSCLNKCFETGCSAFPKQASITSKAHLALQSTEERGILCPEEFKSRRYRFEDGQSLIFIVSFSPFLFRSFSFFFILPVLETRKYSALLWIPLETQDSGPLCNTYKLGFHLLWTPWRSGFGVYAVELLQ